MAPHFRKIKEQEESKVVHHYLERNIGTAFAYMAKRLLTEMVSPFVTILGFYESGWKTSTGKERLHQQTNSCRSVTDTSDFCHVFEVVLNCKL